MAIFQTIVDETNDMKKQKQQDEHMLLKIMHTFIMLPS